MTTKRRRRFNTVLALAAALSLLGACGAEEPALDGRDEPFLSGAGKGDTAGIADGTPAATAVLELASRASYTQLVDDVGLHPDAAQAIVAAREASGTAFATLPELDAVPHVGPVAFYMLLKFAIEQGAPGDPTQIHGPGDDPLRVQGVTYRLFDGLLLAERETVIWPGDVTSVLHFSLHLQAEYLAYDAERDRLVAFGEHNLYVITRSGAILAVYDQGYADIPNLRVDLLAGATVCVVYQNLASYYQGKALGAFMVGNYWAGGIYQWWQGYFSTLYNWSC